MTWQQQFMEHILDRGFDYYHRDLVQDISIQEDVIEATVYGTEIYDVEVELADGEVTLLSCDCPFALDGNHCKHMAAVLFYVDNVDSIKKEYPDKSKENISEFVKEADEKLIRDFLTSILEDDEKLLNRFKSIMKYSLSPEDMKRYKNQINNILYRHAGGHDFIDYYSASNFAAELEEFLDNDIRGMIENGFYQEAFVLTNDLFIKLGNQDIDDSGGETGILSQMCMEIWQEILEYSDAPLKKKMFRWFMESLDGSVIDYMEDYLEEMLFENFQEDVFIAEKLVFSDQQVQKFKKEEDSWSRGYAAGKWAIRHIEMLEEQNAAESEMDAYCEKHLEFNRVRKYYIEHCINRKAYDKAIHLLEDGKNADKGLSGLVRDYSLQLKNIYKQMGNNRAYEQELWSLVLEYQKGNLDIFNELKLLYPEEEWKVQREVIFNAVSPGREIADLYESEKLYDRLLQVVLDSPSLHTLQAYEKSLMKLYPHQLLNKYEMIVQNMARPTTDRRRYQEIVALLRNMKKYPEGEQKVKEIVREWQSLYKNRRAMMDELSRL
ncbi:SWIM zinc finger family protein [Oceanobacillus jeddahense]|uniref:SWIM zinc finger family protein n=1 Tax=Oceanobacillus jeddahense TaxID=1462527 RepID=UPI0005963CE3|nr:SWIM zinc finger family protein [Oceanobacillus jeddahense]